MDNHSVVGVTWGDPRSIFTYSGVPWHLFREMDRFNTLVGRLDARAFSLPDLLRGAVDWRLTMRARRPRRSAIWRYLPESIELLSGRLRRSLTTLPSHDAVLQFGVAGIPLPGTAFVAHVEISLATAVSSPLFSRSYGFAGLSDNMIGRALDGEREFLRSCSLVWTNSDWTAKGVLAQGVEPTRVRVQAPGCEIYEGGPEDRCWEQCHVLFLGKDWERKGGPLLAEAFALLRRDLPEATLTVVGCEPDLPGPGIRVLGYLDKSKNDDVAALRAAYAQATVFCMPSLWESTGIVYFEAAMSGLPVIMLGGQGRETLFPRGTAIQLQTPNARALADILMQLAREPQLAAAIGAAGRELVASRYLWPDVARRIMRMIDEAVSPLHPSG